MAIEDVKQMCACSMPVVPTVFDNQCLTVPEQVGKLTYKVNEVIEATNASTEQVVQANATANKALAAVEGIEEKIAPSVKSYLDENGAPFINPSARVNGITFTGKEDVVNVAICNSDASTVNKTITVGNGWDGTFATGLMLAVKFAKGTERITNATIKVENGTDVKQIKTGNTFELPAIEAGNYMVMHYDGYYFNVVTGGAVGYASEAGKLENGNTINGVPFTGEDAITIACACASTADATEKIITAGSQAGVALQNGSVILVRFLSGNTATGAITFKIGSSSAEGRQAYYNGSTVGLPQMPSNSSMLFVYASGSWLGQYVGTGSGGSSSYILPTATATTLGGVKIGDGITASADGTISIADGGYTLPVATTNTLGGVKVGSTMKIEGGVLDVGNVPVATVNTVGGVKVGNNLSISTDGTLSADAQQYTLPTATTTVKGGIKIGSGVAVTNDVLSVTAATSTNIGGVKTSNASAISVGSDGTIDINAGNGVDISGGSLNVTPATTANIGGIIVGEGLTVDSTGVIASNVTWNFDSATATLNITVG